MTHWLISSAWLAIGLLHTSELLSRSISSFAKMTPRCTTNKLGIPRDASHQASPQLQLGWAASVSSSLRWNRCGSQAQLRRPLGTLGSNSRLWRAYFFICRCGGSRLGGEGLCKWRMAERCSQVRRLFVWVSSFLNKPSANQSCKH